MLIYEDKVPASYRTEFIAKVKTICKKLGIDPNWLMQVMYWESAGTFSPSVKNPNGSATGLIQFIESTAEWLGTSTYALSQMTAVEQLDYVYEYYRRYKSKLKGYIDLYLTTFYPAAVGKPRNYVLGQNESQIAKIAAHNSSFDVNKDGKVTKGEIEDEMVKKVPSEWRKVFMTKVLPVGLTVTIVGVAILSYVLINGSDQIS